jgi:small subunit ribosomal protein S8
MTDTISDMLTRIRNGTRALLPTVNIPHSRLKESIARILLAEGYLGEVSVAGSTKKTITVRLKYQGKRSVIEGLKRVSRPGLRRYVGSDEVPRVRGGLGISIVSTSEGLMTGAASRRKNLGGELICYVW